MKKRAKKDTQTVVEGTLERITYFNEQNHYTIARLKTEASNRPVTLVGFMGGVNVGESLKVSGSWETHPKFGQQLRVKNYEVKLPGTVKGIRSYLASGVIKGLGKSLANGLVDRFGQQTLDVIEHEPERLTQVEGIGEAKARRINEAWKEHHVLRSLMEFLQQMGIEPSHGAKIFQLYGRGALEILRETPYRLTEDLPTAGFQIADTIARKNGTAEDDPTRVAACILHALSMFASDGHTFAFRDNLIARCEHAFNVSGSVIENAIESLQERGEIRVESMPDDPLFYEEGEDFDKTAVYAAALYQAETGLANRIEALLSIPVAEDGIQMEDVGPLVIESLAMELSATQVEVLEGVLKSRASIITGGPGTGKTTLIRAIAAGFKAAGKTALLAAPTGRASRRLSELTGEKAQTIHRMLGFTALDGAFDRFISGRNRDNPLRADVVIVDEASMVDIQLMYHLMEAIASSTRVVLVGDVYQLPSVGPGNVLADLIRCQRFPVFYLEEVFRQATRSDIVLNAHRIRKGQPPRLTDLGDFSGETDFFFLEQNELKKMADTVVSLCGKIVPERFSHHPVHDIQVLTPMHKGDAGTIKLNQVLQQVLNPEGGKAETSAGPFRLGDKVMHLKNNYQKEVFNGDIGVICAIDKVEKKLTVDYEGRLVDYGFTEADELTLAYAISVHKSQGSEYPAVVIPLVTQHYLLLQRNLLYTAVTRGKKLVVITGTQKALTIALGNDRPRKRLSGLYYRLMEK